MTPPCPLPVARTVADLIHRVRTWRAEGLRVALVPTMGALHVGHLALVRRALKEADRVVASVFVNPRQFGPEEDFGTYPRDHMGDAAKLADAATDLLYLPDSAVMYPPGFATTVHVGGPSAGLCGDCRPGFFDGVATVVTKLLLQARPDVALFGEKDYQQLLVIRRLVTDLDLGVRIVGVPVVREEDGLALSSRNAYLTAEQRAQAPALYATLRQAATRLADGAPVAEVLTEAHQRLYAAGFAAVDYLELRDAETLAPRTTLEEGPARLLGAAHLGAARLIDNVPVPPETSGPFPAAPAPPLREAD